jgi:hypothetical protein
MIYFGLNHYLGSFSQLLVFNLSYEIRVADPPLETRLNSPMVENS